MASPVTVQLSAKGDWALVQMAKEPVNTLDTALWQALGAWQATFHSLAILRVGGVTPMPDAFRGWYIVQRPPVRLHLSILWLRERPRVVGGSRDPIVWPHLAGPSPESNAHCFVPGVLKPQPTHSATSRPSRESAGSSSPPDSNATSSLPEMTSTSCLLPRLRQSSTPGAWPFTWYWQYLPGAEVMAVSINDHHRHYFTCHTV